MRWSAELSDQAQKQLARFPRHIRDRIERALDEFEMKALQGPEWKGRYR